MKGYLIYDAPQIARNQRFIDFFLHAAKVRGVQLQLITVDQLACGIRYGQPFLLPEVPDFAVVRGMHPLLSRHMERCGVRVFNNSTVSDICNDKQKTHAYLTAHGIPMLDTGFVSINAPLHPFPYPVVLKASGGCGGRQVYLCEDEVIYLENLQKISPDTAVVQPLCDTPGRDVRVYMLGKTMVQAMLRYTDGDFRSNFGLHGTAQKHVLTTEQAKLVQRVSELFDFALVGVDMIFHEGRAYINEIEDAVGTRMLYQFTNLQIVEMYMDFILSHMG